MAGDKVSEEMGWFIALGSASTELEKVAASLGDSETQGLAGEFVAAFDELLEGGLSEGFLTELKKKRDELRARLDRYA